MGAIEGDQIVDDNSWEQVKKGGDPAIEKWIKTQMSSCDVVIVLVGDKTASRPWVNFEIRYAWDNKYPIFGIRVHGLKSVDGYTSTAGTNPFQSINLSNGKLLSDYVPLHAPSGGTSQEVYANIKSNIRNWIKDAPSMQ